jgi:triacylglycerol lipase
MGGFDELFGVYEYFFGIPSDLRQGGAKVYLTTVSSFASTEARGEQLLDQIEYVAAVGGTGKVNIMAHSHGGLDSRYVMAARPDLVASVTTVATPHKGAELATYIRSHVNEDGVIEGIGGALVDVLGFALSFLSGTSNPQDSIAGLEALTAQGTAAFNARYPAGVPTSSCGAGASSWNGIKLYSWSGTSPLTNILDISDGPMGVTSLFSSTSSDGLVQRCSSHFGVVLRDDYWMNHMDEVNQILGLVHIFATNPKTVFRTHANRLKNAGL